MQMTLSGNLSFHGQQEPITRSLQLPHIPVKAFSQTGLLLVWIYFEFRSIIVHNHNYYPNIPRNSTESQNFQISFWRVSQNLDNQFCKTPVLTIASRFSPRWPCFPRLPTNFLILFAYILLIGVSCIGKSDNH